MGGERATVALLVGALVLLAAVSTVRLSSRLRLPTLLAYLGLGLVLGESGLGVRFDDAHVSRELGFVALALILTEGGLTTRWDDLRRTLVPAASLATVGVGVSVAVTAAAAHAFLGWDWAVATLLAAVLAPTDTAAVFATLRGLPIRPRIVRLLEAESVLNDPIAAILVILLAAGQGHGHPAALVVDFAREVAAGLAAGAALGLAGRWYLRRVALPAAGLYPLALLAFVGVSYAGSTLLGGSGFIAVYVTSLMLGNTEFPQRAAAVAFSEGVAWLAQIGLFVMLGLLASPQRLGAAIWPALAIGAVLTFVARPLSVGLVTLPFSLSWRERAFVSWAGLRGAVPIVLATVPLTTGLAGATELFDVVFVLVVVFTLVQGPTLSTAARRLRVLD
ncbi:MAG: potassium/hydrogen antiporter [Frankiaceae bacterium]|jgi:cell volume regulation protein A|nr:potassium/hydrogen antiporter [Frankiaceae bacterium]